MRIAGIVAEYNPFHRGHLYLMEQIRQELGPDTPIVVIMSGDFVQRGEPALVDRAARTAAVLQCGADLVLELPFTFATGSADRFAAGAIASLVSTGIVTDLFFGAEHDSLSDLSAIADLEPEKSPSFLEKLSTLQKDGASYASAWEQATIEFLQKSGEECTDMKEKLIPILREPNNTLAIAYLRELRRLSSSITPHLVHRVDSYHNEDLKTGTLPSATAIRKKILSSFYTSERGAFLASLSDMEPFVPVPMLAEMLQLWSSDTRPMDARLLIETAGPVLRAQSATALSGTAHMGEKLANHLKSRVSSMHFDPTLSSEDAFIKQVHTKCFPHARIMRAITSLVVGQTESDLQEMKSPLYLRLLGFSERGRTLLKSMRQSASLPILSRTSDALHHQKNKTFDRMNRLDLISHDWWTWHARRTFEEDYHFEVIQFKRNKIYR